MKKIANSDYHSAPGLSSTKIALLLQNARKFRLIETGELVERTPAMDFGSAFHAYVLEPDKFSDDVVVVESRSFIRKFDEIDISNVCTYPDDVLTPSGSLSASKTAKEKIAKLDGAKHWILPREKEELDLYKAWQSGKIIITQEERELLDQMKEKLLHLDKFQEWLDKGVKERSFFGEIDGVPMKCRPDLLVKLKNGKWLVVDIKTTNGEATPEQFSKSSADYMYYVGDYLYREVMRQNGYEVAEFVYAIVSKKDYSGAIYCEHDYTAIELGEDAVRKAVFKYKWCQEHDMWLEGKFDFVNGGFERISVVSLPNWAFYRL